VLALPWRHLHDVTPRDLALSLEVQDFNQQLLRRRNLSLDQVVEERSRG